MTDQLWQTIRYVLIGLGSFLAGRGIIRADQVAGLADQVINAAPAVIAAGSALWGLYVKFRTATVPVETAARKDVPTVSQATGAVKS